MVVCAIIAVLASVLVVPRYVEYARARQVDDAAAVLAQDIAYVERFAENSGPFEGATIEVRTENPLAYTCYSGRPQGIDPQSQIRSVLLSRSFPDVSLVPGALQRYHPFLFAHNGSVQFIAQHQWADQHQQVTIELRSRVEQGRVSLVHLDPFTGAVSAP